MLTENQTERTVLFHEDDTGMKIQCELSNGFTLDTVATTFRNFLISTGFDYVKDVDIKSNDGTVWSTQEEPSYVHEHPFVHEGHEPQMTAADHQQDVDEDIPF